MKLIRLSKRQTATARIAHPVFDLLQTKTDEENRQLLVEYLKNPSDKLLTEIVMSNLHIVRHTVGRYVAHWHEAARWQDDMVSVGMVSLIESIGKMKTKQTKYFRPWLVCRLKHSIETYLNKNRCSVAASLSTNYRRLRKGEPIASKSDLPLSSIGE